MEKKVGNSKVKRQNSKVKKCKQVFEFCLFTFELITSVQECDATGDAVSTTARLIKMPSIFLLIPSHLQLQAIQ